MRDKRPVDELSIEDLERILAIRKREERQQRMERMKRHGRVVESAPNGAKQHPPQEALLTATQASVPLTTPAVTAPKMTRAPISGGVPQFDDGGMDEPAAEVERQNRQIGKTVMNQLLLLVEVGAVLGIVYLAVTMFQSIGKLEQETAAAQQQLNEQRLASLPTIAPTPQLRLEQFVLPGGHTPPTAPGGAQSAVCGERLEMVKALEQQVREQPQAVGQVDKNAVIEVFVSQTGTWTILATGTDGMSCLVASGDGWDSQKLVIGVDA